MDSGDRLEERERKAIARAVDVAYDYLPRERRSLRAVYRGAFARDSRARVELARWCGDDHQGEIFNAPVDSSQAQGRLVAYDCTHAFDRPELASPLVGYLIHQIWSRSRAKAEPTMVYVDETEPMLRHKTFEMAFRRGLQEGRKLRQAFVSCFQRPTAVDELGLGDVVRGQCPTVLFLPNPQGTESDYKSWGLTDAEMGFVLGRTHGHLSHGCLVKRYQGGETAILDTSLGSLGPYLKVYSSGRSKVLELRHRVRSQGREKGLETFLLGES